MIKIDWTWWCLTNNEFGPNWNLAKVIQNAKAAGAVGVELTPPEHWKALRSEGLTCPLSLVGYEGCAPFDIGFNRVQDRPRVLDEAKRQVALCEASNGVCNAVIAFSGKHDHSQTGDTAIQNCVDGLNQLIEETRGSSVVFMLEHLNDVAPVSESLYGRGWRHHPDYDATHPNYVLEVVKRVNSPRCKLLFDIYHFQRQLPQENIVRWMTKNKDHIGHIHVAGDNGSTSVRGELNVPTQLVDWDLTFAAIREMNYQGHVGLEFILTPGGHYAREQKAVMKRIRGS